MSARWKGKGKGREEPFPQQSSLRRVFVLMDNTHRQGCVFHWWDSGITTKFVEEIVWANGSVFNHLS